MANQKEEENIDENMDEFHLTFHWISKQMHTRDSNLAILFVIG